MGSYKSYKSYKSFTPHVKGGEKRTEKEMLTKYKQNTLLYYI